MDARTFTATRGDLLRMASIKEAYLDDLDRYRGRKPVVRFLIRLIGRKPMDPVEGFSPDDLRRLARKAARLPAIHID